MPSQRRQINVRLSEENEERLKGLMERMRAVLGIEVSQSDIIQAGLAELEKRYPADPRPAAASSAKKGKGRGKK